MTCSTHPEVEAVAYCGHCGRPLCAACRREVRGIAYCESCLAARMHSSTIPSILGSDLGPQPGMALFLGFIPGVGAIYNGEILKAVIQVLIFGSLIALSRRATAGFDTVFGLGAMAFYFYMVIDSYQTARHKQLGRPTDEWAGFGELRMNAPISAIVLIVLGGLFLMDNMGFHVFKDVGRYWPVLLIVIGVLLLQRRLGSSGRIPPAGSSPRGSGPAGTGGASSSPESSKKEL